MFDMFDILGGILNIVLIEHIVHNPEGKQLVVALPFMAKADAMCPFQCRRFRVQPANKGIGI